MTIQFVAPFLDHSGYGEASRNTLMAMYEAGLNITTKIVSFTSDELDVGLAGELALKLEKKYDNFDINLIELTPEHFPVFLEKGKYNIGYFFWEVKGIDPKWVEWCNLMDEIWLPSPFFAEMFIKAGVKSPIKIVPCCMDVNIKKYVPFKLRIDKKPELIFYSIFQWTERKNPKALLTSYWQEFQNDENVLLIIKTYRSDFSEKERKAIKDQISEWKDVLNQKKYPKVLLVLDDLSQREIMRLHATGDIFVSTHRGEGWGYSQMAAMAFGNLVISTNFGGIHEYLPKGSAILLRFILKNLWGMDHIEWYNKKQQWADINAKDLRQAFRFSYFSKKETENIAKSGEKFVRKRFSFKSIGKEIRKILSFNDS